MGKKKPKNPSAMFHRVYPYMDHLVQYAVEREGRPGDPWIVRDRSAALRAERLGEGTALVRLWVPGEWEHVLPDEE